MTKLHRGLLYGVAAYTLWGFFPLYWPLLKPATPVEILAHRIAWSLLVVAVILLVRRHWAWVRDLLRRPRALGLLVLAATVISVNWTVYIYAVNTGHVVEGALGYFINPLVSVALGMVIFRERLRPWQWTAVGLGVVAVAVLTFDYGRLPWIALVLACSFGTYGLLKKVANLGAAESLGVETLILFLPATGYLAFLEGQGTGAFGHHGVGHALLLAGAGIATAVPLMLFTAAATRIPLSSIGVLQYIAPTIMFLIGLFVVGEEMPASRWIGFVLVWLALTAFTWDGLRASRSSRTAVAARTIGDDVELRTRS